MMILLVTVGEGTTAENSGSFHDADPGDNVIITASLGTITWQSEGPSGYWTWEYDSSDDLVETVVVTADDGHGEPAHAEFELVVENVAPCGVSKLIGKHICGSSTTNIYSHQQSVLFVCFFKNQHIRVVERSKFSTF